MSRRGRAFLAVAAACCAVLATGAAPKLKPVPPPAVPKGKPASPPAAVPKGERVLGIAVNEDTGCPFETNLAVARTAGLQAINLPLNWRETETAPGKFDATALDKANRLYPPAKTKVHLTFDPVNTNRKEVPADLAERAFDDPVLIDRFRKFLDWALSRIPDVDVMSVAVGNEVDGYLGEKDDAWRRYGAFFKAARAHLKAKRPGLEVGVIGGFDGLTGVSKERLKALNAGSDMILVTYYPLGEGLIAKDPSVVRGDFDRICALYPGRPVFFTEAGFPTSPVLKGSEAKQAEFVRQVFRAWDAHASQVRYVSFLWLMDLSPSTVDAYAKYYGLGDKAFREYLRTMGLRTFGNPGKDKEAFKVLKAEEKARGW